MTFLGCSEAEVIFLGCLKVSWTDMVCVSDECPPGNFIEWVLSEKRLDTSLGHF